MFFVPFPWNWNIFLLPQNSVYCRKHRDASDGIQGKVWESVPLLLRCMGDWIHQPLNITFVVIRSHTIDCFVLCRVTKVLMRYPSLNNARQFFTRLFREQKQVFFFLMGDCRFVVRWRGSRGQWVRVVAPAKPGKREVWEGPSQSWISWPIGGHPLYFLTGRRRGELLPRKAAESDWVERSVGPRSLWLSLSMCFPAGPLPFACQRGRRRPALWLLSRWRGRERDEGHAPHRQLQKSGCTLQVHGKLVARVRGWSGDLIWRMYINSVATLTVTCDLFPAFFLGDGAADHDVTRWIWKLWCENGHPGNQEGEKNGGMIEVSCNTLCIK